jgi:Tfp pilus assembly protein PilF
MMGGLLRILGWWACALMTTISVANAQSTCEPIVGGFASVQGTVEVQNTSSGNWYPANLNTTLCQGASVRVGDQGRAAVSLVNDAMLRIDQNTTVRLVDVVQEANDRSILEVVTGIFQSFSREPRRFAINTPYVNGSIEGTEYQVRVFEDRAYFTVFEGTVVVANAMDSLTLQAGQSASAAAGQAPQRRTGINPAEEVQWALYYPPVLSSGGSASPALRRAAEQLSVGRVDEAKTSIDQALSGGANDPLALALRAVISVTQNNVDQALADATRATNLAPRSVAPAIALSYAQQANFQIEEAAQLLRQMVQRMPNDALVWARLAELELMAGNRAASQEAANQAASLSPNVARTKLVQGFAALAALDNDAAGSAFAAAIDLDSADPMAHLGQGLSLISSGELAAGRQKLEAAVALDSNNALLRAYLGKAYFEEKRGPLDGSQFAMAQDFDPNDPTAYLYDAIRLQSANQPALALEAANQSLALNDNRAVYRSRLLLDKDRASRGTTLARINRDLGFEQLGVNQSARSLGIDPSNAGAHRFLSDTYQTQPRREVARVSELLQAQLLQDINVNPVQPSVGETSLNITTVGGPAAIGFNEFNPLFQRDAVNFNVTGFGGTDDTYGGEAVLSGVNDQLSWSLGGASYDTDGIRDNMDLEHRLGNVYLQYAITDSVNAQFEFRHRESEYGDLDLNGALDNFLPNERNDFEEDSFRLGLRISPAVDHQILVSVIYTERDLGTFDSQFFEIPDVFAITAEVDGQSRVEAWQPEVQYLYQHENFNVIAGAAYSKADQEDVLNFTFTTEILGFPFPIPPIVDEFEDIFNPDPEDLRVYGYVNFHLPANITWTLGLSVQDYEEEQYDRNRTNPKVGVQWDVTDQLLLRAAYFETLKPTLASNRTLEPTQVAGFNQLYDDADATKSSTYGVALDFNATDMVAAGAEFTSRDIVHPGFLDAAVVFEDRDEENLSAYIYLTPGDHWAARLSANYNTFENDEASVLSIPAELETLSVPLAINWFHPSGVFAGITATYVDQEVERIEFGEEVETGDDFVVVDLSVGYRFPKRRGIVSLSIKNLFDEDFDYQDDGFRTFRDEPALSPYLPELSLIGKVTVNF